jgi:hypothetical protein
LNETDFFEGRNVALEYRWHGIALTRWPHWRKRFSRLIGAVIDEKGCRVRCVVIAAFAPAAAVCARHGAAKCKKALCRRPALGAR